MFIICNFEWVHKEEGETAIECRTCYGEMLFVYSVQEQFTLFFIPVFPISYKKYYFKCFSCNYIYNIDNIWILHY